MATIEDDLAALDVPNVKAVFAKALLTIIERINTMDENIAKVRDIAANLEALAPDWIARIGALVAAGAVPPVVSGLTDEEKGVLQAAAAILEEKIALVGAAIPPAPAPAA